MNWAKAQFRARQYAKAVKSFELVSQLNKNYKSNWFNLGLSYGKINNNTASTRAMRESVKYRGRIMLPVTMNWGVFC